MNNIVCLVSNETCIILYWNITHFLWINSRRFSFIVLLVWLEAVLVRINHLDFWKEIRAKETVQALPHKQCQLDSVKTDILYCKRKPILFASRQQIYSIYDRPGTILNEYTNPTSNSFQGISRRRYILLGSCQFICMYVCMYVDYLELCRLKGMHVYRDLQGYNNSGTWRIL